MSNPIYGNMIGGASSLGKTLIITDENGVELTGVFTESEVIFTANAATDIREGKIAATGEGVVTGSKFIPGYVTYHGTKAIPKNSAVTLTLTAMDCYDYTVFHGILCDYNTNMTNSTAAQQIVVYDSVFNVQSAEVVAHVEKDHDNKRIIFNITNTSGKNQILRYITYKEIIDQGRI